MRLRSHLLLLTLATLLPMVVFGVTATVLISRREKAVFQRGAIERTLALLTAVDTELSGHATSLQALASSRSLTEDRLQDFHDEASRVLAAQPGWRTVRLSKANGDVVFDATAPFGTPITPTPDRASIQAALEGNKSTIGHLFATAEGYRFAVRIPVKASAGPYVLSVLVDPDAINAILARQRLPVDWVGVVLDGEQRVVARTVNHGQTVGLLAADSLRRALLSSPEGWFQGATLEEKKVYTPYNRSPFSGWTVAMGIPEDAVEAAAFRTAWLLMLGVLAAVLMAVVLAAALGRRISGPIGSLASVANTLTDNTPLKLASDTEIKEVNDVGQALVEAVRAVRDRESALRAADRAKDEFLAMLGHELRNPLNALAAGVELLRLSEPSNEKNSRTVEIIGRQIRHMTRLIDDLLDVSRVTTGKVNLTRQPIDLGSTVETVVQTLRASGKLDGHALCLDLATVWVEADVSRIEQVVSNLLGNALKYTPPGGQITVRVTRHGDKARIEVEDTGVGLSQDLLPRIFDLFVQGERSLDRSLGGLGIGLTLVKRLVELHGGEVYAHSDGTGRGSRFTVELTARQAPPSPDIPPPDPARPLDRRRILLVEDNEDARRTLAAALALHGHEVLEASDGPGGLELAQAVGPEVAIVDIGLPGMDGYELARRLRSSAAGKNLLLIALTGYGQAEAQRMAKAAGFDAHFAKPASPEELARLAEDHRPFERKQPAV